MNTMQTTMYVLNIGFGSIEGTPWANANVLDSNVEHVENDGRVFKGSKTAKINVLADDNQQLARRLERETFPCNLDVSVEMSIVGGKTSLKIVDFKPTKQA